MNSWQIGKQVRVKHLMPPGHVRTPHYLRGKSGRIERILGPFPNPEDLAYGVAAPNLTLLRVTFSMGELWGKDAEDPNDSLEAEVYAHWLEDGVT